MCCFANHSANIAHSLGPSVSTVTVQSRQSGPLWGASSCPFPHTTWRSTGDQVQVHLLGCWCGELPFRCRQESCGFVGCRMVRKGSFWSSMCGQTLASSVGVEGHDLSDKVDSLILWSCFRFTPRLVLCNSSWSSNGLKG